jgi:hypothetical protein
MTIRNKTTKSEIIIDLTGPDGNAYVLLGKAKDLARQLELDATKFCNEMTSADYDNLISVFDKYFGHIIVLER